MDLEHECSDKSHFEKSSCDSSAQNGTRRATLRELMQLPADCSPRNFSVPQIKTSEHLECQGFFSCANTYALRSSEQDNLEQLEAVSKQYKRWGIWKCVKGLSWSLGFKPRNRENNKPQRNNNGGALAKVTKPWKKNHTPQSQRKIKRSPGTKPSCCSKTPGNLRGNGDLQLHCASSPCGFCDGICSPCRCGYGAGLVSGCGDLKVDLKSFSGVEHDDKHSCQNLVDYYEKHNNEASEVVEGYKWKTSSFDTHDVEIDVNEESLTRNLQQKESTYLEDVRLNEMCEEFNDHMLAKSCYGGSAEKSTYSRNASALISADYGSPDQNAAAALMSQSQIWEYFELIEVWTAEEERLRKQEAVPVPKEYKWWGILNGDKRRSAWSSLCLPRDREY